MQTAAPPMTQVPLPLVPALVPSFANFVVGDNAAVLQAMQQQPVPAVPVYCWGDAGSGKTHLLGALTRQAQAAGVRCHAWAAGAPPGAELDPACRLVLIDDVQALSAAQQHAVFALLVQAQSQGAVWAAAGSVPPVDLPLRDDLRSRLCWGLVFEVRSLDEAQTRAALLREAGRRGIVLSDDVLAYLWTRFDRDLGHLMRLLDRLDGFALARSRAVTVPLLKTMLAEDAAP